MSIISEYRNSSLVNFFSIVKDRQHRTESDRAVETESDGFRIDDFCNNFCDGWTTGMAVLGT